MIIRGILVAALFALPLSAQDAAPEDGVLRTCLAQGQTTEICICASLVLHARLGDAQYVEFGAISDRIAAIEAGADAESGEMAALTSAGYRFFVPHGQAMGVCRAKLAARE